MIHSELHSTTPAKSTPKNKPPKIQSHLPPTPEINSIIPPSPITPVAKPPRGRPRNPKSEEKEKKVVEPNPPFDISPSKPTPTENSSENSPLLSALKNCVKEQQGLWIRYSGGSNPGTWRKIFPSSISNAQSFRAVGPVTTTESKNSGKHNEKEKNFRVDRIVEFNVDINFQPPESKANNNENNNNHENQSPANDTNKKNGME